MATINTGTRFDVSSRSKPDGGLNAGRYNRVVRFSGSYDSAAASDLWLTGSLSNSARAFIIKDAGDAQLYLRDGGALTASELTGSLDSVFEIGVKRVSGSGDSNIDLLF
jgi:hypothetical protein